MNKVPVVNKVPKCLISICLKSVADRPVLETACSWKEIAPDIAISLAGERVKLKMALRSHD